jgi:hypothetical protein
VSESEFPKLFSFDQIDEAIPHDPTVDRAEPPRPVVDPDERHPLERQFPHVVDRIVGLWNTPMCDEYLQSLLLMGPGEFRQGFPPDMIEDLLLLDYCHRFRPVLLEHPGRAHR